jgi:uncharacterized membrane protein
VTARSGTVIITPSCSAAARYTICQTLAGGYRSAAYAINDRGDIVGFSEGAKGSARGINDAGRIVGTGWLNGQQRGFLLTP